MRAIVLAAGIGNALDGMVKCLIRHPLTNKTILDHIVEAFTGMKVTVVVGYRAVEVMQAYPQLQFVYNPEWAVTNNAYSLSLALDDAPTFVVAGDFFISPKIVTRMAKSPSDVALVTGRENRPLTAIHCTKEQGRVAECYMGPLRSAEHDEILGMFKISSPQLLKDWKTNGIKHPNLFAAQTLPLSENHPAVNTMKLAQDDDFFEINTVEDYMRLMARG